MKEKFRETNFKPESLTRIRQANDIIVEYRAAGLVLTLRQLYYQFVSRNIIPNVERSYKNLSALLNDARVAGLVDWNAIEDRVRQPVVPSEWTSISALVESAVGAFRLPRWEGQDYYAELWVEKDALAGVLEPLGREFHVTVMVNRGYSSASAMYDSASRFKAEQDGKTCRLFYLGDFDPSGEDMVRDIRDRLRLFEADVEVTKIALTPAQIEEYRPPPNPAKTTDPRSADFIAKNGATSYEVDALPPDVLQGIIRDSLESVLDREMYEAVIEREEEGKEKLTKAAAKIEV